MMGILDIPLDLLSAGAYIIATHHSYLRSRTNRDDTRPRSLAVVIVLRIVLDARQSNRHPSRI